MARPVTRCPHCDEPVNRPGYRTLWDHVKWAHIKRSITRLGEEERAQ